MSVDESPTRQDEGALVTDDLPDDRPADVSLEPEAAPGLDEVDVRPESPAGPAPVEATARLSSVDVLRGVALLGILAMNIVGMAWPGNVYSVPTDAPGSGWGDLFLWLVNHIVLDTKMMTIFSMLFGAGLVLMADRAEARGVSLRKVYYRRVTFLLLIGLTHAYLIWDGDVLVDYALCGFLLYPFRKKSAKTLIVIGAVLLCMAIPAWFAGRAILGGMRSVASKVDEELRLGPPAPGWRFGLAQKWHAMNGEGKPKEVTFQKDLDTYRGGYGGIVADRAKELIFGQTVGFVLGVWWLIGGRMMLGMGLMKLGVFSASRSVSFYRKLALLGYGVGLPLVLADVAIDWHHRFFVGNGARYFLEGWWLVNWVSSPFMALGHVAVVMLIVKAGAISWLTNRLAAVGRMALSNYLFDSIVGTTLFYGYGLGLYGTIYRPGLYLIVASIWAFQLWFSPIWLARFRFGPAEWAWRSLTYGKPQRFRRDPEPVPIPA